MRLVKSHGSRNEIFIADARPDEFPSDSALRAFVRRVCGRQAWTGGGDGVYFFDAGGPQAQAWFFNPDGSSAEFCGNGMRGLGRFVLDLRGTGTEMIRSGDRSYTVRRGPSTPEGVRQVLLEMPPVSFGPVPAPPFAEFTAVTVPNPHVVAVVDKYVESDLIAAGESANSDRSPFAEGANVSFLQELGTGEVFVRTFERGAGLTPSCGSGVVASRAVYSRVTGADPGRRVVVRNAGGLAAAAIEVRNGAWFPTLEGNATFVYHAGTDFAGEPVAPPEYAEDEIVAYAALDAENAERLAAAGVETAPPG
jgi:diaminopimelate epimerase